MSAEKSNNSRKIGLGAIGNLAQSSFEKLLTFILYAYLARHLSSKDFGVISLLMIIVEVGNSISNQGTSVSLTAQSSVTKAMINTGHTITCLTSLVLTAGTYLLAKPLSMLMHIPDSYPYLQALSFLFFLRGFATIPSALLLRDYRFNDRSVVSAASMMVSALVTMLVIMRGGGGWALVTMYLTSATANLIGIWIISTNWPGFGISFHAWKELRSVSTAASISSISAMFTDRLIVFSLGRWGGASALGEFGLATRPSGIVWMTIIGSIQGIALPSLNAAREKNLSAKLQYTLLLIPSLLMVIPILLYIAIESHDIIRLLYGPKWDYISVLVTLSALTTIFLSLTYMRDSLLPSLNHSKPWIVMTVIRSVLVVIMLFLAVPHGATGVAFGSLITTLIMFGIWQIFLDRNGIVKVGDFLSIVSKPLFLILLCAGSVYATKTFLPVGLNTLLRLVIPLIPASLIYVLGLRIIYSVNILHSPKKVLKDILNTYLSVN
jgi:PST family polysaccharide transporter